DKNGNTITTTVQPPMPGQTGQTVTTTVTPQAVVPPNAPAVAGQAGQPAQARVMVNGQPEMAQQQKPPAETVAPADVKIPAGTTLSILINQHISVKTSRLGDRFDGAIASPVTAEDGRVIVPR